MSLLRLLKSFVQGPKQSVRAWFRHQQVLYHNPDVFIAFPSAFQYDDLRAIRIARGVIVGAFAEVVVLANSPYSRVPGQLIIHESVVIGSHANIRATGGLIVIGRNTSIAQHVSLIASNHLISSNQSHPKASWDESKTGVVIGQNVWIGANATILPGCTIGNNSVVGAGSVVTKSIPPNEVWAGVPARKIRDITPLSEPQLLHPEILALNMT